MSVYKLSIKKQGLGVCDVCVHAHMCECVHLCVCMAMPEVTAGCLFLPLSNFIFDTGSPVEPGASHLARLAG